MIVGMTSADNLQAMITSFRISAALSVAAELGISDLLASGPRTLSDLAAAASADEDTLRRLLRALVTIGVYAEPEAGVFAGTALGDGLRSDVPGTFRPLARTLQDPAIWSAWGHLAHSVRTGENAFEALHGVDIWTHRERRPEQNAVFNENMAALSYRVADAVALAYDFSGISSVVDVGGGHGILLEAVLTRHAHLTGTVFDLSHAVATAPGSPELAPRWASVSGSFFESVPPADAYLMKSILHDWPDDKCVEILGSCRDALHDGGVVLLVERVLDRSGYEADAAFSDLNMLVLPGGRERTEQEYAALFEAAGFHLTAVVDTATPVSIVEARVA
jgi:hypothetical protein